MYSKIINLLKSKFPKILSVYYKIRFVVRAIYIKEPRAHLLWILKRSDKLVHKKFNLNSDSVFFDVGGFEGKYAEKIIEEFDPYTYIFEPHPLYFEKLQKTFKGNKKVKLFDYALGAKTETAYLTDDFASSSISADNSGIKIKVKNFIETVNELKVQKIDLLKINIEGSEYDLLDGLLESNVVKQISTLKIQFHENVDNYDFRRNKIRENLSKTHKEVWSYYMVWECWDLIE
jgi:FkbM family methyltransferase